MFIFFFLFFLLLSYFLFLMIFQKQTIYFIIIIDNGFRVILFFKQQHLSNRLAFRLLDVYSQSVVCTFLDRAFVTAMIQQIVNIHRFQWIELNK